MGGRGDAWVVVACLAASVIALGVAPAVVGDGYSVVEHTTSESAAQRLDGAWAGRLGFLAFGFGVFWLAVAAAPHWTRGVRVAHGLFGVLMTTVAAFSIRPWAAGVPYDGVEDLLHSVGATAMGFAFVAGMVLVGVQRLRARALHPLDIAATAAGALLPPLMAMLPHADGALQRAMFCTAYAWYAREALRGSGPAAKGLETRGTGAH